MKACSNILVDKKTYNTGPYGVRKFNTHITSVESKLASIRNLEGELTRYDMFWTR